MLAAMLLTACTEKPAADSVPETAAQTAAYTETTVSTATTVSTETTVSASGTAGSVQAKTAENGVTLPDAVQTLLESYLDAAKKGDTEACVKLTNLDTFRKFADEVQYGEPIVNDSYYRNIENMKHQSYRILRAEARPDLEKPYARMMETGREFVKELQDESRRKWTQRVLEELDGIGNFFTADVVFDDHDAKDAFGFLFYQKNGKWVLDGLIADEAEMLITKHERIQGLDEEIAEISLADIDILEQMKKEGFDPQKLINKTFIWKKGQPVQKTAEKPKDETEYLLYAVSEQIEKCERLAELRFLMTEERAVLAAMDASGLVYGLPGAEEYGSLEEAMQKGLTAQEKDDAVMQFRF